MHSTINIERLRLAINACRADFDDVDWNYEYNTMLNNLSGFLIHVSVYPDSPLDDVLQTLDLSVNALTARIQHEIELIEAEKNKIHLFQRWGYIAEHRNERDRLVKLLHTFKDAYDVIKTEYKKEVSHAI
jgi:hypothetical protein